FELRIEHEVTDLVTENDRVTGVRAKTPDGELDLRAILSLARMGTVPRSATGPASTCANSVCRSTCFGCESPNAWRIRNKHSVFFRHGKLLVLLDRGDYWQCGYVIPKGTFNPIKARGLSEFHQE